MKNNFAAEYAREQAIKRAYDEAEQKGNEAGMEQAREGYRTLEKEIEDKGDAYGFFYGLFKEMKEAGNEHIDLHNTIRDEAKMIAAMRDLGIETFTFSSGWSSAVESAWIFQTCGCKLEGLIGMNIADKMEMEARLMTNLADWIEGHGNVLSDRSRSNAYTGIRIRKITWRGRTFQVTDVDGMTCRIERVI